MERLQWAIMLYQNLSREIHFLKQQQWYTVFFAVLLNAVVYFALRNARPSIFSLIFATLFYVVLLIFATVGLRRLHQTLERQHRYLSTVKSQFINVSNMLGETDQDRRAELSPLKDLHYHIMFQFSLLGSACVFLTLIWLR